MKGGHNRKPSNLKLLQGTARPDRQRAEPKPRPLAPAKPPFALDAPARRAWNRLRPELERLGLLTEVDADVFACLCAAEGRYLAATKRLRTLLKASPVPDAALIRRAEKSVEMAEQSMRLLGAEFGLSPASRGRIDLPAAAAEEDPLEMLLRESDRRPK